jgi:hypothetical protein
MRRGGETIRGDAEVVSKGSNPQHAERFSRVEMGDEVGNPKRAVGLERERLRSGR